MPKNKQFLTCAFKLHQPTYRKRQILDYVLNQYTSGMTALLNQSQTSLDLLTDWGRKTSDKEGAVKILDKYDAISIGQVLPGSGRLDLPIAACLKESLSNNVASMIASYFELQKTEQKPNFPAARDPSPQGWPHALEDFALVGGDLVDENESRRRLLNRAKGNVMPIHYIRSRDFALLFDRNRDRFFIWLKLLPSGHELAETININQDNLIDLNTGEIFKRHSDIGLLLPLEIGRRNDDWYWQYHHFLQPIINGQAAIQSAKLIREDDKDGTEYFFHVSFAFDCPEPYKPEAYLGIDRGVFFSMAYGIIDLAGSIIEMGHKNDGFRHERIAAGRRVQEKQAAGKAVTVRDYRQKHLDSVLYALTNDIIALALKHRAMIILEDLNIQIKGSFYKSAWQKMHKFIEYKCKLAGVPVWRGGIWAAYSSQICIYCGALNRDRKRDGSSFKCADCSAIYHSDEGAGINIARRVLYRKADWSGKGGYWAFHRSFANTLLFEAKIDLRNQILEVT